MSMLAEQRRKTKWVINTIKKPLWATDSSGIKFGKELMEKMGWSAGKGLGLKEQGIQEPLRVSLKNDTKGMGFKGNVDHWIEYQDEFNSLLSQLRGDDDFTDIKDSAVGKSVIKSLEEKSKSSKTRVHYQKFTRGKDLSQYSENDLACILGTGKTKKEKQTKTEALVEKESHTGFETSFGVTTINSGSINDYFKKKWTIGKTKSFNSTDENNDQSETSMPNFSNNESFYSAQKDSFKFEEICEEKTSPKKKDQSKTEEINVEQSSKSNSGELENVEKIKKKRKKENEGEINSVEPKHKRKKYCGDTSGDKDDFSCENDYDYGNLKKEKDNIIGKKQKKASSRLTMKITTDKYCYGEESSNQYVSTNGGEIKDLNGEVKFKEKSLKKKIRKAPEMSVKNNLFKNCDNSEVEIPETQNGTDLTESCLEIKTVKRKKKKKEKKEKFEVKNEKSCGDLIQYSCEAIQDMERLNTNVEEGDKKTKKEKLKEQKDYDNYTLSNQDVLEPGQVKKKRKKKNKTEKLDENMFRNLTEENRTEKNEVREKNNVMEESLKKKKKKEKKAKENVKEQENEPIIGEDLEELSEEKMENKIDLSKGINLPTGNVNHRRPEFDTKSEGEKRIEKLKPTLFEDAVAQKYFPREAPSQKVLRLIKWANISEFKGANLKDVEGYGRRKIYEKKSR